MAYWGPDIFESDFALCTLSNLLDPFIELIEKNAANPETSQWDEVLIDELIISASILMTLLRAGFPIGRLPQSSLLKQHRESFVKKWREYAGGDEFQEKRLTKILEIWDEMTRVAEAEEQSVN